MKNSLNRSVLDEHGCWWFIQANGARQRARVARCATCDCEFLTYPAGTARFCSAACIRRACERCGQSFQPTTNRQVYCCLACKAKHANCQCCGEEFVVGKGSAGKFCSTACHYEHSCPTGSIRDYGGGYKLVKVKAGTPGAKRIGRTRSASWMLEHRYVMQLKLGRPLATSENVHHINGKRDDNRPENLELWKRSQPCGVRASDYHCSGCQCFRLPVG